MNDFGRALAALARDDDDDDNAPEEAGTMPASVQRMELRQIVEAILEPPEDLQPGDFLAHKFPHLATSRFTDQPVIFIAWLDEPVRGRDYIKEPRDIGEFITTINADIMIGVVTPNAFVTFYDSSRHWRKHTDQSAEPEL